MTWQTRLCCYFKAEKQSHFIAKGEAHKQWWEYNCWTVCLKFDSEVKFSNLPYTIRMRNHYWFKTRFKQIWIHWESRNVPSLPITSVLSYVESTVSQWSQTNSTSEQCSAIKRAIHIHRPGNLGSHLARNSTTVNCSKEHNKNVISSSSSGGNLFSFIMTIKIF